MRDLVFRVENISARRAVVVLLDPLVKATGTEEAVAALAGDGLFLDGNVVADEANHVILEKLLCIFGNSVFSDA